MAAPEQIPRAAELAKKRRERVAAQVKAREDVRESSLPERVIMSEGLYDQQESQLTRQESAINRLLLRRQQELSQDTS
jgi:hypothetical protein